MPSSSQQDNTGKIALNADIDFAGLALARLPEEDREESNVVFYCKNCEQIVDVEKKGNRLQFLCKRCRGDRIAFGTEQTLERYYHITHNS